MLAVASVIVVTAFPLLLKRTPHQAAWWGGILLLLSMIAFIVAFLLAGFVTVSYNAPTPGCASLKCDDGGIMCQMWAQNGLYYLDDNIATLNKITSSSNSSAVCVRYDESTPGAGGFSTLTFADSDCGTGNYSAYSLNGCPAVRELLEEPLVQQQTVCMDYANFPQALTGDPNTYDLIINSTITNLTTYFVQNPDSDIIDLLALNETNYATNLFGYDSLSYVCQSREDDQSIPFDTLCDISSSESNLSVTKTGEYLTEATASTNGALVFHADVISNQVARAIEALSGFFGLVLIIIIAYLIKSKVKY